MLTITMSTIQVYKGQPEPKKILEGGLPVEKGINLSSINCTGVTAEDLLGLSWLLFEDE